MTRFFRDPGLPPIFPPKLPKPTPIGMGPRSWPKVPEYLKRAAGLLDGETA